MKKQEGYTELYVNPVPRIPAQGRDKQRYTILAENGRVVPLSPLNKTREAGTTHQLSFQYSVSKQRLNTGLDEMVINPFYKMEVKDVVQEYNLNTQWNDILPELVKQERILKQTLFEILSGVEKGYYTSQLANGTIFEAGPTTKVDNKPNFLERFKITLYDKPNRFTDETPRGRLAIELIKKHNKIANSKDEMNPTEHLYYISEKNEAEQEKIKRREIIDSAIYNKEKLFREYSAFDAYKTVVLLKNHRGEPVAKGDISEMRVKTILNDYITSDNAHQMENIDKFMKTFELLSSREGKIRFEIMYLIQQAINTNVIGVRDGYYTWHSRVGSGDSVSKFTEFDKLVAFMTKEFETYNEDDDDVTNWYGELYKEVKNKEVRL